jgi:hypothetical protein
VRLGIGAFQNGNEAVCPVYQKRRKIPPENTVTLQELVFLVLSCLSNAPISDFVTVGFLPTLSSDAMLSSLAAAFRVSSGLCRDKTNLRGLFTYSNSDSDYEYPCCAVGWWIISSLTFECCFAFLRRLSLRRVLLLYHAPDWYRLLCMEDRELG